MSVYNSSDLTALGKLLDAIDEMNIPNNNLSCVGTLVVREGDDIVGWILAKNDIGTVFDSGEKTSGAPPNLILAKSVSLLLLRSRACHGIARLGIKTIGDLCEMTGSDLTVVKNFGPDSLWEVRCRLADHGLRLADGLPGSKGTFAKSTGVSTDE